MYYCSVSVKKRSISNKMRALGIFKGAKVKRGIDWEQANQDGASVLFCLQGIEIRNTMVGFLYLYTYLNILDCI